MDNQQLPAFDPNNERLIKLRKEHYEYTNNEAKQKEQLINSGEPIRATLPSIYDQKQKPIEAKVINYDDDKKDIKDDKKNNQEEIEEEDDDEEEVKKDEEPIDFERIANIANKIFLLLVISLILISLLIFIISFINLFLMFYYTIVDIYKNIFNYNNIYLSSNQYTFLTKYKDKNTQNDMFYISMEQNYIWKSVIIYYMIIIILGLIFLCYIFMLLSSLINKKKLKGSLNDLQKELFIYMIIIFLYILFKYAFFMFFYKSYVESVYSRLYTECQNIDIYIYKILFPDYVDSNSNVNIDNEVIEYLMNDDIDLINNKILILLQENNKINIKSILLTYTLYRYFTTTTTKHDEKYYRIINYISGDKDRKEGLSFMCLLNIQNKKIIEKYYEELDFFKNPDEKTESTYAEVISDINININNINKFIMNNDNPSIPFMYLLIYLIINFIISLVFIYIIIIMVKDSEILPEMIKKYFNILYNVLVKIYQFLYEKINF